MWTLFYDQSKHGPHGEYTVVLIPLPLEAAVQMFYEQFGFWPQQSQMRCDVCLDNNPGNSTILVKQLEGDVMVYDPQAVADGDYS